MQYSLAGNTATVKAGGIACIFSTVGTGECNVFWQNSAPLEDHVQNCAVILGQDDNLVADPLFCDAGADNYELMVGSPGDPDHPSGCGLRGAFPVGCGPVSVSQSTWGATKALYR